MRREEVYKASDLATTRPYSSAFPRRVRLARLLGVAFSAPLPLMLSPLLFLPAEVRPRKTRPFPELIQLMLGSARIWGLCLSTRITSYQACLPSSPTQ